MFIFIVGLAMVRQCTHSVASEGSDVFPGRFRVLHAYIWRPLLVDAFLRFSKDPAAALLPRWIQQHLRTGRRALLD